MNTNTMRRVVRNIWTLLGVATWIPILAYLTTALSIIRWPNRDRCLWSLAFALFVVGDMATTHAGLLVPGVIESNQSVVPFIETYGVWGTLGAKSLVVCPSYLAYRLMDDPARLGIPIGLSLLGAAVTAWNLYVIFLALG